MPEYIELEPLRDEILNDTDPAYDSDTINHFLNIVDSQPTADVVEVVRCKDCTFGKVDAEFDSVMCFCRNAPWDNKYVDYFVMSPLDYCSYGKKKEGAENDRLQMQTRNDL